MPDDNTVILWLPAKNHANQMLVAVQCVDSFNLPLPPVDERTTNGQRAQLLRDLPKGEVVFEHDGAARYYHLYY